VRRPALFVAVCVCALSGSDSQFGFSAVPCSSVGRRVRDWLHCMATAFAGRETLGMEYLFMVFRSQRVFNTVAVRVTTSVRCVKML